MALKRLEERHSGAYLSEMIKETLDLYEVFVNNVFTSTIDNGANMLKMTGLLQDEQEQSEDESSDDENNEIIIKDNDDESGVDSDSDVSMEEVVEGNEFHPIVCGILQCVRCAAHTLQLAVLDTLKKNMKVTIKKVSTPDIKHIF